MDPVQSKPAPIFFRGPLPVSHQVLSCPVSFLVILDARELQFLNVIKGVASIRQIGTFFQSDI
jgi:hypothetical protein